MIDTDIGIGTGIGISRVLEKEVGISIAEWTLAKFF